MKNLSFFLIMFLCSQLFGQENPGDEINNLKVSINGTFKNIMNRQSGERFSPNQIFKSTFEIGEVTDEQRNLYNLKFYRDDDLLFTMVKTPGSDFEISNSGIIVFYDHSKHFIGELSLHFYSPDGQNLFSGTFKRANGFLFSESGNIYATRTTEKIITIEFPQIFIKEYEKGLAFSFDETGNFIAIADEDFVRVYQNGLLKNKFISNFMFPRRIALSSENDVLVITDKRNIKAFSLNNPQLLFSDELTGDLSFRDLKIIGEKIATGIHKKNQKESQGVIRIYESNGSKVQNIEGEKRELTIFPTTNLQKKDNSSIEPIPWPHYPFDSTRTIWNHYEQHMGGSSDYSYLHQGLDLITPIGEPTYAVKSGIVKLVLTLGGNIYWRVAISDSQNAGVSDGWLYAHLIPETIQVEVGDTVQQHDYLGDIVEWTSEWGHIHFVEIKDSGIVWLYTDGEWGINFNPMLALTPLDDTISPIIAEVFPGSLFGFCTNETSNYMNPDSLYGQIDIIVQIIDASGDSEWQQPGYEIYYWIKRISNNEIILERKLAHILNHKYEMYNSNYYEPYATVLYKRDATLPSPSWMDPIRGFYHILTNSDGDSLIDISEKGLSFNTSDYYDSEYRIYVEVFDEEGNSSLDSMDVSFKNGISSVNLNEEGNNYTFRLEQNYPNPFNPSTSIQYALGSRHFVTLNVYDVLGNLVATLVDEEKPAGNYEVEFQSSVGSRTSKGVPSGFASGIYFYQINAGSFVQTRKMILLR